MAMDHKLAGHKGHCTLQKVKTQGALQESKLDFSKLQVWESQLEKQICSIGVSYDTKTNTAVVDKEVSHLICQQAEDENSLQETIDEICHVLDSRTPLKDLTLKRIKLPTKQLAEFEFEYIGECDYFWVQFHSNINFRSHLPDQLKGNAKKLISGFSSETTNYKSAMALPMLTYENKDKKLKDWLAMSLISKHPLMVLNVCLNSDLSQKII